MKANKASKIPQLMQQINEHVEKGRYLDTRHASNRKSERQISRPEILHVLKHGYHEKRKDRYESRYQTWNYAIRGRTIDHRSLRIVVGFENDDLLIITTIDLNEKKNETRKNKKNIH